MIIKENCNDVIQIIDAKILLKDVAKIGYEETYDELFNHNKAIIIYLKHETEYPFSIIKIFTSRNCILYNSAGYPLMTFSLLKKEYNEFLSFIEDYFEISIENFSYGNIYYEDI